VRWLEIRSLRTVCAMTLLRDFYSQTHMQPCCSHPLGVYTDPPPALSAHTEPISQGNCWKWHHHCLTHTCHLKLHGGLCRHLKLHDGYRSYYMTVTCIRGQIRVNNPKIQSCSCEITAEYTTLVSTHINTIVQYQCFFSLKWYLWVWVVTGVNNLPQ